MDEKKEKAKIRLIANYLCRETIACHKFLTDKKIKDSEKTLKCMALHLVALSNASQMNKAGIKPKTNVCDEYLVRDLEIMIRQGEKKIRRKAIEILGMTEDGKKDEKNEDK